jgi:hypothetical protein
LIDTWEEMDLSMVRMALAEVPTDSRSIVKRKLIMLGYKYYMQELNSADIDVVKLTKLLEKPLRKSKSIAVKVVAPDVEGMNEVEKENETDEPRYQARTRNTKKEKSVDELRRSRANNINSYPFADTAGSVANIMKGPDGPANTFCTIGAAARKRMAKKVYDEYLLGRAGMPLECIPGGLTSLGLTIGTAGEKLFQEAAERKKTLGTRATLSFPQWNAVVERYVKAQLKKEKEVTMANAEEERIATKKAFDKLRSQASAKFDEERVEAWEEAGDEGRDQYLDLDGEGETDLEPLSPEPVASSRRRPAPHQQRRNMASGRPAVPPPTKQTYSSKLKKVRSKIGGDVRADRHQFMRQRQERAIAGLAAVGKNIIDNALPDDDEIREEDLMEDIDPDLSGDGDVGGTPIFSGLATTSAKKPVYGKPIKMGRWKNLDSGSAALEIAESFFKGAVGRELMQEDPQLDESHPFAKLLGVADMDHEPVFVKGGLGHGHKTAEEVAEIKEREHEANMIIGNEGWTRAKGGWAMDYGPPTTRKLSTKDKSDPSTLGRSAKSWLGESTSGSSSDAIPANSVSLTEAAKAGFVKSPKNNGKAKKK